MVIRYVMHKKPKQKKILITAIALILALGFIRPDFSSAQEQGGEAVNNLTTQKNEKNRQLLEIKTKVADLQKQIIAQASKIASLANEVKLYDLQIEQTAEQIAELDGEIEVVNLDIIDTLDQITTTNKNIGTKKELLIELIREIDNNDRMPPLKIVLAQNSFSELLNEFHQTLTFQNRNQELLSQLQQLNDDLKVKQDSLQKQKANLTQLKEQQIATKNSLIKQQSQKASLLSYTKGQESKYKQLLNSASEEEAKIGREIYDLDLQIRQKLGDKTLPPVTGALAWPMEGVLTQGYGNTGFTKLGYTFHNGIDVAAPANTPVHAAADGVVFAVGYGKASYGNWVVVKHTLSLPGQGIRNIYTLYAHFNSISVKTGQAVLQGDLLGLEGNTGNTTRLLYGPQRGYHVHFGIYDEEGFGIKDGAYTDVYGPYQVPYGYTYNPLDFLK